MAGREEAEKWAMRPCTAAKSTMAGDHGPATRVVSNSKRRKAVARSSRKKGEQRPECAAAGAGDRALLDPHGKAAMPAKKVVGASAGAAQAGSKGKRRLKKSEIRTIIALKSEPFPEDDYLDGMAKYYPPEWLELKKREHAEDAAYFGKIDADYEAFRKKVMDGVKDKGYFEVDEGYMEKPDEYHKPQLQKVDLSELMRFAATPEEELRRQGGNGYHEYVTDEEDDAVLARVRDEDDDDDDDFLSDGEDSSVSDEDGAEAEGADVHKVAAIVSS